VDGIRDQRQAAGEYSPDDLCNRQKAVRSNGDRDPPVTFLGLHMAMIVRHEASFFLRVCS